MVREIATITIDPARAEACEATVREAKPPFRTAPEVEHVERVI
jgi:hypothetical protein